MIDYQKFETKRIALHETSKKNQLYGGLLIILAIVFSVVGYIAVLPFLFAFTIAGIIAGAVFFGKAQKANNEFRTIVKSNIIVNVLEEHLEDVNYDPKSAINIERINKAGLVKRPDRIQGEDYVSASYKGVKIESSDYTLLERVVRTDSKGNRVVTYEPYFKGRWLIYKFKRKFDEVLKVSESFLNTRGLQKVQTESILFNKKFNIFASTEHHAFYLITPVMLEKLMELEQMHKGTIMFCFMDDELHVGINDNRNYFEMSLKKPINENSLKSLVNEVTLMAAVVNEFKLDSPKFNN